uniref:MKRN2 opposite strand protein n=1 Tax=Anopheles culicifacies TaxID=139723 RepID=A0A182MCE5_9DIPT
MYYSQDLMCVRHCNQTIFSYDILTQCPLCAKPLGEHLDSTPITSFQNQNNLHIGLTSSNGTIVEFDANGLTKLPPKSNTPTDDWDQCLVIARVPEPWYDRWDEVLEKISCDSSWRKEMYKEDTHNCYAFVLSFLSALEYGEFYDFCHDKLSFSKQMIASKTQSAAKYITIHRKLQTRNYFIEEQG